jgi:hypothetical protein
LAEKRFIERVSSTEDGRQMLVYPTRRSLEIEKAPNEASGKITRQLRVALGQDVFEGTVNSVLGPTQAYSVGWPSDSKIDSSCGLIAMPRTFPEGSLR